MRIRTISIPMAGALLALTACGASEPEPDSSPSTSPPSSSPATERASYEYEMWWEPTDGADSMPVTASYQIHGVVPGISIFDALIPSEHDGLPHMEVGLVDEGMATGVTLYTLENIDGVLACEMTNLDTGEVVDAQTSDLGPEQRVRCTTD